MRHFLARAAPSEIHQPLGEQRLLTTADGKHHRGQWQRLAKQLQHPLVGEVAHYPVGNHAHVLKPLRKGEFPQADDVAGEKHFQNLPITVFQVTVRVSPAAAQRTKLVGGGAHLPK